MRNLVLAITVATAGLALGVPGRVEAQTRSITCESQGNKRHNCNIAGLNEGSVRLEEQDSSSPCIIGSTWGTDNDVIWVSGGCRGRFSYRASGYASGNGNNNYGYGGNGYGSRQRQTCASDENKRRNCSIPGLDEGSVRMEEQESSSSCIKGRTWGTSGPNIWVSGGCRAVFSYLASGSNNGYGNNGYNSNSYSSGGRQRIECNSEGNKRNSCSVDGLNSGSVRMEEQLSGSDCIKNRTWGTSGNAIWVSGGCRAVFSYKVY